MNLKAKILLAIVSGCVLSSLTVAFIAKDQLQTLGHTQHLSKSRAILSRLDATRSYVANQGLLKSVIENVKQRHPDGVLSSESKSDILKVVPIFAAMKVGEQGAELEGYKFRVSSTNPRSKDNQATELESTFISKFQADPNLKELEHIDTATNALWIMRPVRVTEEDGCLNCHGDPANSPWKNGKDILGIQMENMQSGDIKGMFTIISSLDQLDQQIFSSLMTMGIWSVGILITILGFVIVVVFRPISKFITLTGSTFLSLSDVSKKLSFSSDEMSRGSESLAQRTTEQAASLEEAVATISTVADFAKRNAENAQLAADMTVSVSKSTSESVAAIDDMKLFISNLENSSAAVEQIIKTIEDIAFQTNLLALNAAVEAARAGDAGKGFSVVAEEVRSLARLSAEAAKETARKISESVKLSKDAVKVTNKVEVSLNTVSGLVAKKTEIIHKIADASKSQATNLGEINQTLQELQKVTEFNAAGAEESSAVASSLRTYIVNINDILRQLAGILKDETKGNNSGNSTDIQVMTQNDIQVKTAKSESKNHSGDDQWF